MITDEQLVELRTLRDTAQAAGFPASAHLDAASTHVTRAISYLRAAAQTSGAQADSGGGGSTDPDR